MSLPKLMYLTVRGRGEKIRVALEYGGIAYEDVRMPYVPETFAYLQGSTPYAQLPVLDLDGAIVAQSDVILEWACEKAGLIPKDPVLALQCKGVIHWLRDIEGWWQAMYLQEHDDAGKAACRQWWYETKMPQMAQKLEAIIGEKPYFFGDRPTMADIAVVEGILSDPEYHGGLDRVPAFQRIRANLHAEPALSAYYTARAAYEATPAFQHTLAWYRPVVDMVVVNGRLRTPALPSTLPAYPTPEAEADANRVLRGGPRAFRDSATTTATTAATTTQLAGK